MNINDFVELLKKPASFMANQPVIEHIKAELNKIEVPFTEKEDGTIFNLSNAGSPVLVAHTDTVRTSEDDNEVALSTIQIEKRKKYSVILNKNHILGGDDLCGVYLVLKLIEKHKNVNFIFSNNEEVGEVQTIRDIVLDEDFSTIPYCLVLDRMGSDDICSYQNNYGTKEFENELAEVGRHFGFSPSRGYMSDCDFLRNVVSTANISVGYFNPHSKKEYIIWEIMENTFKFVDTVIQNVKKDFGINPEKLSWYFERQILKSVESIYNTAFARSFSAKEMFEKGGENEGAN